MRQISKNKLKNEKIFGDGNAGTKMVKIIERINISNTQKRLCYK